MLETILAAGAGRGAQYELDNPEHARAEYMLDNNGERCFYLAGSGSRVAEHVQT
jgi:hypothetical protein